jgi:Tol biopolymer transport system component
MIYFSFDKNTLKSLVLLYSFIMGWVSCYTKIQEEIFIPIESKRIQITNDPWPKRDVAWSPDGTRMAFASDRVRTELSKFSITENRETGKLGDILNYIDGRAALSFDGRKLAYFSAQRRRQIRIFNFQDQSEKSLPIGQSLASEPAWSRDGEWLAYTAWDSVYRNWSIWIIQSNGANSRRITSPIEMTARAPTWSLDGAELAFQALKLNTGTNTERIWIASVAGGAARRLTSSLSSEAYPAWSPDGSKIAFLSRRNDTTGVWTVSLQSGEERKLTSMFGFVDAPSWSPDGSKIAFRMSSGLGLYSLAGGNLTRLFFSNIYPLWLPDGNTIVVMNAFNFSQVAVVELQNAQIKLPIAQLGFPGDREPAWFPDNNTIAFTKAEAGKQEIWTISLSTGASRPILANIPGENFFQNPAPSPDGKILACDNGQDIFLVSTSGGEQRKLADDLNEALSQPAWSPDSKQLACRTPYGLRIFRIHENRVESDAYLPGAFLNPSWSAIHSVFGSHIAFERDGSIYIFSVADQETELVIPGGRYPSWSPDGTKIAYVFGNDIYVSTVLVPFSD